MEAETKRTKGRPQKFSKELLKVATIPQRTSKRTQINSVYIMAGVSAVQSYQGENGIYRITGQHMDTAGPFKRRGVLEQLGRFKEQDNARESDLHRLIDMTLEMTDKGYSAKQIQSVLHEIRKEYAADQTEATA